MEPERILSGTKDMADRILPAAAKFAQDSSPETRWVAANSICCISYYKGLNVETKAKEEWTFFQMEKWDSPGISAGGWSYLTNL